jgi:hypothetical protein
MRSQIVISSEVSDSQLNENSSQFVMSSDDMRRSQIVTASDPGKFRNKKYLPLAFTEHGVSMLASVLRSEKAVQMSIAIVRAFIALKQYAVITEGFEQQIRLILDRLDEHDVQLNGIYKAIENLLKEKADKQAEEQRWLERERIGFK